jgi:endonuclease YncB( thermonuclease family)
VLRGNVINVVDGDTLDVQVGPGKHRKRLAEIDAPERNQPWGDQAKQHLASKVLEQEVRVVVTDTDRYGRRVGKIFLGQTDINRLYAFR